MGMTPVRTQNCVTELLPVRPLKYQSLKTDDQKNSQKFALHPIATKIGKKRDKIITQSLRKFQLKHLNVPYTMNTPTQ